ncbi:MAG: hypothetical protein H0U44_10760 [Flavisolibacter sp.]|jgi:hypothetical protein|nr:hypothetical protein [Flavisolibacter sp.]
MKWKSFWEKIGNWELWPFELRYLLITPVWAWYCLRSGSLWFFTPSNPTISFGGFEGEGKKEMYEQLPENTYPKTIYIIPGIPFHEVAHQVAAAGFHYPFIVKPDVGMKGLLFRKIEDEAGLATYHSMIPFEYIVQELVTYPLEVSVFYYRYPNREKGVITGFIQKSLMEIEGDGKQTIGALVATHPKARFRIEELFIKHQEKWNDVLLPGEKFFLAHAANLNRGATFTNLNHLIDDDLLKIFDALSLPAQFYYGRYDIKCTSVKDLKQGNNFSILEYNGSGAEPNHVYHSNLGLIAANQIFLAHWKALFEIARYNHEQGFKYWTFKKGWEFLKQGKKHLKVLEKLDKEIPV